jgi:hypothetical protein
MTTKEAIQAMLDGKKVTNKDWPNQTAYMYFDDNVLCDSTGNRTDMLMLILSGTWEIYEETKPKQTVTIEKWLCKNISQGSHFIFDVEKGETILYFEKVKLLETYEIEL